MEFKIKNVIAGAGQAAKNAIDSAVQAVDQNGDGKVDLSDAAAIAGNVGDKLKQGARSARENAEERMRELELKALQPIFTDSDVPMPRFVRVMDRDKKHAESAVCQGSIGYESEQKDLHIVNVFRDSAECFGVQFYPDTDSEFYYVDPSDRNSYIALDEYFSHLKSVRISELQKIAQDLGAKHFKVTYKEEQTSFSGKKAKAQVKAVGGANAEQNESDTKYSMVHIAAEMDFPGHEPKNPQLRYMKRDANIRNLVEMRLDESSPLLHQKYMLKMSDSSGMKESNAVKIDAVLKGLKCSGNTTVESEVKNESRRYLEYEIDF